MISADLALLHDEAVRRALEKMPARDDASPCGWACGCVTRHDHNVRRVERSGPRNSIERTLLVRAFDLVDAGAGDAFRVIADSQWRDPIMESMGLRDGWCFSKSYPIMSENGALDSAVTIEVAPPRFEPCEAGVVRMVPYDKGMRGKCPDLEAPITDLGLPPLDGAA